MFAEHAYVDEQGAVHAYDLADRNVRIGYNSGRNYFACARSPDAATDGPPDPHHQYPRRCHLAPLAHAMFGRWRQENFFR